MTTTTTTTTPSAAARPVVHGIVVVFLDIDGVMLPFPAESSSAAVELGRIFPARTVAALSTLCDAVSSSLLKKNEDTIELQIVLSSTWRVQKSMQTVILQDFGMHFNTNKKDTDERRPFLASMTDFYDVTDPAMHTERQHEIYDWLFRYRHRNHAHQEPTKIVAWICLDDEELLEGKGNAKCRAAFVGHTIRCDSRIGLTHAQAIQAILLLERQLVGGAQHPKTK